LLPRATRFAVLVNPDGPLAASDIKDAQASAKAIGWQIEILTAGDRCAPFSECVPHLDACIRPAFFRKIRESNQVLIWH